MEHYLKLSVDATIGKPCSICGEVEKKINQ